MWTLTPDSGRIARSNRENTVAGRDIQRAKDKIARHMRA